ncbi:helix-turn-helix domain-containing protein [Variovorax guangxiensis]|uniref:helix-turn-helix domain-containing protein n=1 Tax=Variovorax guangxiensis TaxID=1775474 RepID=UPI0038F66602
MLRCHLQELMAARQLKAAELARLAGVNRSTVASLASESASRIELAAIEQICRVLGCQIGELLEILPEQSRPLGNSGGVARK